MDKCTGNRCPMQYGYKVEECNHTDCPYRTEPQTNADRIRAMSDEELAVFMAKRYAEESIYRVREQGHEPTATQIKALHEGLYMTWFRWLRQPAEVDNGQA